MKLLSLRARFFPDLRRIVMRWLTGWRGPTLIGSVLALAAPAPANAGEVGLRAAIADALVRPAGHRFEAWRWSAEPEMIVLYFGAGWCAPCHELQPRLRAVYDRLRAQGVATEVVFVSLDRTERDALRHIQAEDMPWPALDGRRLPSIPALRRWAGEGTPNLVLVDRDGQVLARAWEGDMFRGASHVLRRWIEHATAAPAP